jgi:NADH-quinone oxidoreductase subunit G
MDAVGSAIRVDTRGREVMRILPRVNEAVNEEWISDKTRFVWDGLRTQRLDRPYVRENGGCAGQLGRGVRAIAKAEGDGADKIGAIAGDLAGVEEMFALKELMTRSARESRLPPGRRGARSALGRASLHLQPDHRRHRGGRRDPDRRRQPAPRGGGAQRPHPQALARRAAADRRDRRAVDLTYPYEYLGAGPETLADLADGKGASPKTLAEGAKRPLSSSGRARWRGRRRGGALALAAKLARRRRVATAGTASRAAHRGRARRRPRLGFVPGEGGVDAPA